MRRLTTFLFAICFYVMPAQAQDTVLINNIIREVESNNMLRQLGMELTDGIGPRLMGTPQMKQANEWLAAKYQSWGIKAENQRYGEWRGWERGITHIDMISPRVHTLTGRMLAWSPATPRGGVTADVVLLPDANDSATFANALAGGAVRGKLVLISRPEPTGRTDANWEKYGRRESIDKMRENRSQETRDWNEKMRRTGLNARQLATALENAGALGLISSNWSREYGANKIFGANTRKVPTVDVSLEDYGMLYRMVQQGIVPKLRLVAESKDLGMQPAFNTIATIPGSEKADEYVVLSAHFDSWDGGTGATDNATGTLVMMEAMRLLKKYYPNPKRTIVAGHWGGEEQGLNGSRAYVYDNPEMMKKVQAVLNQDNGTGRIQTINGSGFLHAYDFLGRWLSAVPSKYRQDLQTHFPGSPGGGGSDHASFVAAGVPGFFLSALSWDYGTLTWHTNLDTYDKIVFDDVEYNVIITAILAYMASEDPEFASREQMRLRGTDRFGRPQAWPPVRDANRRGGMD